jgi:hypothetical protein
VLQVLDCARDAVYVVTTLKDIRLNVADLRHSPTPHLQNMSQQYQHKLKAFYQRLLELLAQKHDSDYLREQLSQLSQINEHVHQQLQSDTQHAGSELEIAPDQLSTLLNINREVRHSGHNLLRALDNWYLL